MDISIDRVMLVKEDGTCVFTWKNNKKEIMLTEAMGGVFPGKYLFILKDTMGLPLDFGVSKILSESLVIDWTSYIEEARSQGRWDYQTYADLKYLRSELNEYRDYFDNVILRFKNYVLKHGHPLMN